MTEVCQNTWNRCESSPRSFSNGSFLKKTARGLPELRFGAVGSCFKNGEALLEWLTRRQICDFFKKTTISTAIPDSRSRSLPVAPRARRAHTVCRVLSANTGDRSRILAAGDAGYGRRHWWWWTRLSTVSPSFLRSPSYFGPYVPFSRVSLNVPDGYVTFDGW